VDGQHLDGVERRLDGGRVEAALLLDRRVEPGQEPPEVGPVGRGREGRGHLAEGVEVGPGRGHGVLRTGQDLDVETQGALALADQLGQRQTGEPPEVLDHPAQRAEPVEPGLRDPLAVRTAPCRRRQVVERLDDARPVGALRGLVADLAQGRMTDQARLVAAP
jgi:hypothetical protein